MKKFPEEAQMDKKFQVGNRVKFFEKTGRYIEYGTIEVINEDLNSMTIRLDGYDGKSSHGASKIGGRWLAFSTYDREYTLEVIFENKLTPDYWFKSRARKFRHDLLDLIRYWKIRRLIKTRIFQK